MTINNFKPILFSTEMVQAILAGRKTQTRRVIKIKSTPFSENFTEVEWKNHLNSAGAKLLYGGFKKGDILYIRETFTDEPYGTFYPKNGFFYKADDELPKPRGDRFDPVWKPSIFMPKEAARIFLKVTNVRVERLQDISEEDAIAEGIEPGEIGFKSYNSKNIFEVDALWSFKNLWQSINAKKHPWDSDPWVWVYEFEKIEKPENFLL